MDAPLGFRRRLLAPDLARELSERFTIELRAPATAAALAAPRADGGGGSPSRRQPLAEALVKECPRAWSAHPITLTAP